MANWSSLPPELISLIANRLPTIEDFSAFTAVCRCFRSSVSKEQWGIDKCPNQQPPWLLLSCPEDNHPPTDERGLLSLYRNNKRFLMNLPELLGRRCWGSPHGWIITLGLDLQLHLFNPLNRRRILLPELTPPEDEDEDFDHPYYKAHWMRGDFIRRVLLVKRTMPSNSPCFGDGVFDDFFVVAAPTDYDLRVMRPQNNSWVLVEHIDGRPVEFVLEVVNYKGVIYALCLGGRMLICSNFDGPEPPSAEEFIPAHLEFFNVNETLYLVESEGDLLLVARYVTIEEEEEVLVFPSYFTASFRVFKLDQQAKRWFEIEDLGNRALFVGDCQSVSLSPAEKFNCRSNCIYFNDDNYEKFGIRAGGHDMGIFDLGELSVRPFYKGPDTQSSYSTPTWFIPTFT